MKSVTTPHSQTDPYNPEPSHTSPVWVTLVGLDGKREEVSTDTRVMDRHTLVQHDLRLYSYRCDDFIAGKWVKIYRECQVVDL